MRARVFAAMLCTVWLASWLLLGVAPSRVRAIGERSVVDLRSIDYAGRSANLRPTATRRWAWEVRQRTSVDTRLEPSHARFSDPSLFETPLVYWNGDQAFPPLSEAELQGLRRFVSFGGFVIIDDASPEESGFDASVRRELGRAFGSNALVHLPDTHVIYRSFYLVSRPVGRVQGPAYLEAIEQGGRIAVVYTRHDLGGAFERDNVGNYTLPVLPGADRQREMAWRLGVNLVLYALCLDYKDDQVHAPFIMRRWAGRSLSP